METNKNTAIAYQKHWDIPRAVLIGEFMALHAYIQKTDFKLTT